MYRKKNYLGTKIYDWRIKNEVSQEDFADMVGVSRQTVQKWEAGVAMPQSDKLHKISEIIGIGLNELMSAPTEAQPLSEVVADEVAQEGETKEENKDRKVKLSSKSKITIVAIVLLLVLLVGILLIVIDKVWMPPSFEGAMSSAESVTLNLSLETIGWTVFCIALIVGIILSVILICKTIKSKKKIKDETNSVEL